MVLDENQYQCQVLAKMSLKITLREGSKFMGYPGLDHRQGGKDFFEKKRWTILFVKKSLFEDQKVIGVESSDSSAFMGV